MKILRGPVQEIQQFNGLIDFITFQLHQYLMSNQMNLLFTDEYKLFFYIRDNANMNIPYFFNLNFENERMGFIPVKRNIRISSEALLDLYNLINVDDYKTVLQYINDHKSINDRSMFNEKFKNPYSYNGNFTILSKLNIARDNGFGNELDFLGKNMLKEMNKYIHASIFIQPNNCDDRVKLEDVKNLMTIELSICKKAIECLCAKYNFDFRTIPWNYQIQLYPGCYTFEYIYKDCVNKIDNMDLIDQPNPYYYTTQTVY